MTPEEFAAAQAEETRLRREVRALEDQIQALTKQKRAREGPLRKAQQRLSSHAQAALASKLGARVAKAVMNRFGFGSACAEHAIRDIADLALSTFTLNIQISAVFCAALSAWVGGAHRQRVVNADPGFDRILALELGRVMSSKRLRPHVGYRTPVEVVLAASDVRATRVFMKAFQKLEVKDQNLPGVIFAYLHGPLIPAVRGPVVDEMGAQLDRLCQTTTLAHAVLSWCWKVGGWVRAQARSDHEAARPLSEALLAADLAQIVWGLVYAGPDPAPRLETVPVYLPGWHSTGALPEAEAPAVPESTSAPPKKRARK